MSDLFAFFDAMNSGNYDFVNSMSDDEVKKLSPFVLLMWCNGAVQNNATHTILTDTYCNEYVFSLSKHPRLLLKLFIAANSDIDNTRYKFRKSTTSEETATIKKVAKYYGVGYDDAKSYFSILPKEDIEKIKERFQ